MAWGTPECASWHRGFNLPQYGLEWLSQARAFSSQAWLGIMLGSWRNALPPELVLTLLPVELE